MRALLVFGVLALAGAAQAAPIADHGAVGVSTARGTARARVVRLLDPSPTFERASVSSGSIRRVAIMPSLSETPAPARRLVLPRALLSAASMVRVSPSSGALRITW